MPASRIFFWARTRRCARVGSGTRKARGDLGRGQAAEGAQRQRHACLGRQRRVAAGEDEPQAVIGDTRLAGCAVDAAHAAAGRIVKLGESTQQPFLLDQASVPAQPVDGLVARGGDDPAAWVVGYPEARPALDGHHERVLDGFLGQIEVAQHADETGDRTALLLTEDLLDELLGRLGVGQAGSGYCPVVGGRTLVTPMAAPGGGSRYFTVASRGRVGGGRGCVHHSDERWPRK